MMPCYFSGWAMDPEHKSLSNKVQDAARRVNGERDIETLVKTPMYGRTRFEGKLKEGSTITEDELLAWVDHGNLCFGGECTIKGLNFIGSINTD